MRKPWFALVLVGVMLIAGLLVYDRLPAQVPSHWNIYGEVDGTLPRAQAILFAPALAVGLWALLNLLPRIDPRRASYAQFSGTRIFFTNLIVLFLAVVHLATLVFALGWPIDLSRIVFFGLGALLAGLGNEMGRVQPNWFVGIRTPWTLSNDEVWRRTHRVGGRAFVLAGLAAIVADLMLPLPVASVLALSALMLAALGAVVYSYVLWRRLA